MHILLVEDSKIAAIPLRLMLEETACRVDWTETGAAAQTHLTQQVYDLMLLDLGLPDIEGLDLASIIRQQPRFAKMPIVALTAHAQDTAQLALAREIGLNGFLSKPLTRQCYQALWAWLHSAEYADGFFTA